ncbi:hemicentin-1-like [Pomacea canaliculata]|uniref:hemicentin-1-like n=1 Tax=Pomacea canaliculata TaxID=400727 RepID=UPI000D73096C|nr:hemicentin-1-like [Pomacea canaliculata]
MEQGHEVHILQVVWTLMLLSAAQAQLKWLTRPQHTVVALSQDLVLDCQAAEEAPSGGSLKYTWLFNNSTLQTKVHFFANASLFVPRMTPQDAGNYSCTVMVDNQPQDKKISAAAQVILAYIDDFVVHPQNTTTALATDVTLTCVTGRSAPYPAVWWEMDDQVVEDGRTVAVTYGAYDGIGLSVQVSMKMIRKMMDERARAFRCVARNVLMGQTVKSRQAVVSVQVTPSAPRIISSAPGEVMVVQHQQVTFDCKVQSYPPSLIQWFKNEEPLNTSEHQCDVSSCSVPLVLTSAAAEDAGMYSCRASNSEGFAVSNTTRLVFAYLALDFKVQPSDTSALAGSAVTLHCTPPDSVPPANVTWYKNFLPFAERTGQFAASVTTDSLEERNLYFVSVQEKDAGQYYCVASNNYTVPGSRTSTVARLTVTGSPLITEPPLSTQVVKGSLLHLRCAVDFSAVTTVYWLYGGQKIVSSQTVSLTNRGQDLWVSNVGKSWEGIFTCMAENSLGQKSATAMVVVIVPPVKLEDLGERQASVGSTVLLPCSIYGDPTPSLSWFHNEQQIFKNERMTLLLAGLYIDKVAVTDSGDHACLGKNIGGQIWSNGTLDVTVPPTISVDTQNISAAVNQSLTLTCKVDGHPLPSVYWLHNDSSILDSTFVFSSRNTSLTIPSFTWSLAGQYTCIASNIEGTTNVVLSVTAQAAPKVLSIVGSTQVNVNTNINLTCVYQGAPSPVVTWFSSGKRIMSSLDGRVGFPQVDKLMIMFAQKSDEGLYTCLASNILGNSSFSVRVLVTEPPRPPELQKAQPLSTNSVLLNWKPATQIPGTMVTAFIIRYRDRVSSDNFLYPEKISPLTEQKEISGLSPGVEYIFTVSAENSAGEGPASNSLVAMTFPLGPSVPRNVKILSTTSTTAEVSWEMPAQSNGNIRIYQLQYRPYLTYTGLHSFS